MVLWGFKRCFIQLKLQTSLSSHNWVRTLLDRICWWAKVKSRRSLDPLWCFLMWAKNHISSIKAWRGGSVPVYHPLSKLLGILCKHTEALNRSTFRRKSSTLDQPKPRHSCNNKIWIVLYSASCCLFISRRTEEERPNPKHDHMFKPCPMNPKQDVTAGPPVRVTDMDTGTQEGYCFALLWERQREGKGSVVRDREIERVFMCAVAFYVFLLKLKKPASKILFSVCITEGMCQTFVS